MKITLLLSGMPIPGIFDVPFDRDPDQPLESWEKSSCLAEIVLVRLSAQALRISSSPHFQQPSIPILVFPHPILGCTSHHDGCNPIHMFGLGSV